MYMEDEIPVIALDGLDEAIIGTCVIYGDIEVIAYDFYKIVELFSAHGFDEEHTREWASTIEALPHDDKKPVFIYSDQSLKREIYEQRSTLH